MGLKQLFVTVSILGAGLEVMKGFLTVSLVAKLIFTDLALTV